MQQGLSEKLRLARLLRRGSALGIGRDTWEAIRGRLFNALGMHLERETIPVRLNTTEAHDLNLRLRWLIDEGSTWRQLEPLILQRLQQSPELEIASSAIELALMHGSIGDAIATFGYVAKLMGARRDYWLQIHPSVRFRLIEKLWAEKNRAPLVDTLFSLREKPNLIAIERRVLFAHFAAAKNPEPAWRFFQTYKRQLISDSAEILVQNLPSNSEMSQDFSGTIELSAPALRISAAKIAIEMGAFDQARTLVEDLATETDWSQMAPDQVAILRAQALEVLCSIDYDQKSIQPSNGSSLASEGVAALVARFKDESDWRERLHVLNGFLLEIRENIGKPAGLERVRAAADEICRTSLSLIPQTAAAWRQLSQLLLSFRDLAGLVSGILEPFRQNAAKFHAAQLDYAFWTPLVDDPRYESDDVFQYWFAVANLHLYVAQGPKQETLLWRARRIVARWSSESEKPVPVRWQELVQHARTTLASAHHLLDYDRKIMIRQCLVAQEPQLVSVHDIEEYLKGTPDLLPEVLPTLLNVAKIKQASALELRILRMIGKSSHFTNSNLESIWNLAVGASLWDDAWRAATILHVRGVLHDPVRCAWEISGEHRQRYAFQSLQIDELAICFAGMSPPVIRLIRASLEIGAQLPELLALAFDNSELEKLAVPSKGTPQFEVYSALERLDWLPSPQRTLVFGNGTASGPGNELLPFAHILPRNLWSLLVMQVSERLGVNAWGWTLSLLTNAIAGLVPRVTATTSHWGSSSKVARFLKNLTPAQRNAWQDIAGLSRLLSDEEAKFAMATFVCRVATAIYQAHFEALESLQQMHAPVDIIWDLEQWLLSEDYARLRRSAGTTGRVPVPNSIRSSGSIRKFTVR